MPVSDAYRRYLDTRFFIALDGLRCISIIAVIWHHTLPESIPQFLRKGFLGVDLFFVISGFLIVTLLLREYRAKGHFSLRKFYIRRTLRIFPVYYGFIAVMALLYLLFRQDDPDADTFFALMPIYLLFLSNWSLEQANIMGIYWSLAAEEQFYLIWPFIEKLKRRSATFVILFLLIAVNVAIGFGWFDALFIALYHSEEGAQLKILDSTFAPILLGVLLAKWLDEERSFGRIFRIVGFRGAAGLYGISLMALMVVLEGDISGWPRLLIQVNMVLFLASLVIREDTWTANAMDNAIFRQVGRVSYGMYVYHLMVLHLVRETPIARYTQFGGGDFIACALLTFVVAFFSFRFYESFFQRFKPH